MSQQGFPKPYPPTAARQQCEAVVARFTVTQIIKAILSDILLGWAVRLLPRDSPEFKELANFTVGYLQRSLDRRPAERKGEPA